MAPPLKLDRLGHVQDPDRTMEEAVAARPRRGLLGKLASCHGKVGGRGERYAAVLRDALNIIYIMRNAVSGWPVGRFRIPSWAYVHP